MKHGNLNLAFIGSAGIPNVYGGFESFLEHCGPELLKHCNSITVTCDSSLYSEKNASFQGIGRVFIAARANGWQSVLHDFFAFLAVFRKSTHIIALGVSGGPWFPLMRVMCSTTNKKLIVNVDGVEWRRGKHSPSKRVILKIFDFLAQYSSHKVIVDNKGLIPFLTKQGQKKCQLIAYSGDHIKKFKVNNAITKGSALTICRIEPENQLEILIEAALSSSYITTYTIIGNWKNSKYGIDLRNKYKNAGKLQLLDPIYDLTELGRIRSTCEVYLHGHSVGGTNPSLVEMLFHDCIIHAYDCEFNRATAGDSASYFSSAIDLSEKIEAKNDQLKFRPGTCEKFTAKDIADQYIKACLDNPEV